MDHLIPCKIDRMKELILILGGARSGKSTYAEKLAWSLGQQHVLYVATAEPLDQEMLDRIEKHQQQRPRAWRTLEAPRHPGRHLLNTPPQEPVILLDCMTLLVSNILLAHADDEMAAIEAAVQAELADLIAAAHQIDGHFIIVSNEVGLGLVPDNALGRAYRDLLGRANQTLAQAADRVIFMVAGLPMTIKGASQSDPMH